MTNYTTFSEGSSAHSGVGDMSRARSSRSKKEGGGDASKISSAVNLLNTIIGAGTLAMPSVLSHMGITLGTILIVWSGITAAFGLYLQSRCARYLDRGHSSFFALSKLTYPKMAILFDAAIAIKCFGVGVSYIIIIGDLMPGIMRGISSRADDVWYLVNRNFWITVFMMPVILLSFLKRLDSLKVTSMIALGAILYLAGLVVLSLICDGPVRDKSDLRLIKWEGAVPTLSSLPVVIFAYTCHQNMFSVLNEIKDSSPGSIVKVVGSSISIAAFTYILVAITGYLTFGNAISGNIIQQYAPGLGSTFGKGAIVLLVAFSIPLQVHPCRASLNAILNWRRDRANNGSRSTSPGNQPLLGPAAAARGDHEPTPAMSETRFALLSSAILVLSYVTALCVSSLDRVLAFVGSTGSTSISFILPGIFYYKISDPDGIHHQRLSKEDDDVDDTNVPDDVEQNTSLSGSTASIRSSRGWRWDLEHLEHGLLRKLALGLFYYGLCVMAVCLIMNIVFLFMDG